MEDSGNATYGRAGIDQFIQDCLVPETTESGRPLPIIILLGPPGGGKTALLDAMRVRLKKVGSLPFLKLDLAEFPLPAITPVLDRMVGALCRPWTGFGRVRFPRYAIVRLALTAADREPERTAVLKALRDKSGLKDVEALADPGLQVLTGAFGLSGWIRSLSPFIARIAATERALYARYSRALSWYEEQSDQQAGSGLEALLEFALSDRSTESAAERTEHTLCAAFLADLNAAFRCGGTAREDGRSVKCAVLLDNVHAPAGIRLLRAIVHARTRTADPALVVATSKRWLEPLSRHWTWLAAPEHGTGRTQRSAARQELQVRSPESASRADWCEVSAAWADSTQSWYPIALRDLRPSEVAEFVRDELGSRYEHLADFLHRLTAGHPRAVAQVARAVRDAVATYADVDEAGLRAVLDQPPFDDEKMLAGLLPDLSKRQLQALISSAAAPDLQAGLAAWLDSRAAEELHAELADRLWLARPEAKDLLGVTKPLSVIHPWVRRFLLTELAQRNDRDAPDWTAAHHVFRSAPTGNEPIATRRLYHALALGELPQVVLELVEALQQQRPVDTQTWLAALNAITSAPVQPTQRRAGESPEDRMDRLVADAVHASEAPFCREYPITTSLVAALWVHNDPMLDPHRTLGSVVASKLRSVSDEIPVNTAQLHAAAKRYKDEGRLS
ncbi:hypothetical protein [Flindersiella endophytica]